MKNIIVSISILVFLLFAPSFLWLRALNRVLGNKKFNGIYYYTFTFRYGIFFYDHKVRAFYFEFLKIGRRILIVFVLMILHNQAMLVLMIIILINFAFE